jgi:hypothetical protein
MLSEHVAFAHKIDITEFQGENFPFSYTTVTVKSSTLTYEILFTSLL